MTPRRLRGKQLMSMDEELDWDATWIGRRGGISGTDFANDLESGTWSTTRYRVATALAAPNRNWFGYEQFRNAVEEATATARDKARTAKGWKTITVVNVESGTAAFARLDQRLPLVYPEPLEGWEGLVGFETHEDGSYPVEERTVNGQVVELRLDLVTDVDEVEDGAWEPIGQLNVGPEGAMVAGDPYATSDTYRQNFTVAPGRWLAQIFRTPDDTLGIRLLATDTLGPDPVG